jgi:beta-lactamase superfamily II metal-dependent hydrolase/uncharacterized protein YcfL
VSKAQRFYSVLNIALSFVLLCSLPLRSKQVHAAGTCGTGTWTSGNLEIHHINIGQGDATLIVGPTGKSLLFDAGERTWNSSTKAQIIGPYIEGILGCRSLDYVLISHFHLDHIGYVGYGGLWNLVEIQGFTVGMTLLRDYNTYLGDISGTFTNWKEYLEGPGQLKLNPVTTVEGTNQVDLGAGVTFKIVALDGNEALLAGDFHGDSNPPSENDYSIGVVLSYGNFDEWIGGDLSGHYEVDGFGYTYHDIELSAAPEVRDVDVYKANHHGSSRSSSPTFINQLDPEVSIVTIGNSNTYGHPAQSTMDRLLATSTVYLTERGDTTTDIGSAIVAGTIVIKTSDGTGYTVNGTSFTATAPTRSDADRDGYFAEADPDDGNSGVAPSPNGGCGSLYQTCSVSCQVSTGQVLINEFFPSPSSGPEWVELYNTTASTLNIGYCVIDDVTGGSPAYQIPASTFIPPHGFWTLDRTSHFNNDGDEVRFLKEDASTILDSYSYGNTSHNLSRVRFPDGASWAGSPTASPTKGQSNTLPYYPIVSSVLRADENPTDAESVQFTVSFSKAVTGVNTSAPFHDFTLTKTGMAGAFISAVNGSGAMYAVTVNTGSGNGNIRLDVLDDDSIKDGGSHPLGGAGGGNGNFAGGEAYTVNKPTNVDVFIGEELKGEYFLTQNESRRQSYANTNSGPVKIVHTETGLMIAAERAIYKVNGSNTSFTEMMALPNGLLDHTYWLPWYNNKDLDTQLRFANVSGAQAAVHVSIGGVEMTGSPFSLAPGASTRKSFAGIDKGPVKIESNQNIVAAERVIYKVKGVATSFSEMMALSNSQLDTIYWLPWYNNKGLDTQLRLANVSDVEAAVHVTIGGVEMTGSPFSLAPGASTRKSFAGIDKGPVRIESNQNIVTAERVIYKVNGTPVSFSETMALPNSQVDNIYWLPWYNNRDLDTQLRIANVSSSPATVHIYIGGVEMTGSPFNLPAGESTRRSFAGIDKGPVKIESNQNIVAAERIIYKVNNINTSFSELMGLPHGQLDTAYWLPWYNNVDLGTQLRFGVP